VKSELVNRIALGSLAALPWWDIAAAAALLAWTCALAYTQQFHQAIIGPDQIVYYFPAAQKVLEGQGYRAFAADVYRGPGYPVALAIASRVLHTDLFTAGKVIAVLFSTMFLLFAYRLLRRVFDPVTGLASLLVIMGVNTFAWVSCANGSNIPHDCLALASLYFIARHDKPGPLDAVLAGLLSGLALTVRWNGLFLPLLILAWLLLVPQRELGLLAKARLAALYALAFLIASGPWLYENYLLHGSPLYSEGAIGLDPAILQPSTSLFSALARALRQDPVGFVLRFVAKSLSSLPTVIQGLNRYPWPGGWLMAGTSWVLIPVGILALLMQTSRLRLSFLVASGIWWASLMPVHYEPRFYILLFPAFAALMVYVVTGGGLPDVKWMIQGEKRVVPCAGRILDRLAGARLPAGWTGMASGTSLTSLLLVALLAVTALFTVRRTQASYRWQADRDSYHHELADSVGQLHGPALVRPIGTRQWSQARYWLPLEAGIAVAPLPGRDYESVLPGLSYVLYDQVVDQDVLLDWWDDPALSALADPLRAPTNMEAVYYKPDSRRAILYRILEQNDLASIIAATASSASPQQPETHAFDDDAQTWWSSALRSSADEFESLTLDLEKPTRINRVWLLPRPDGQAFPAGLSIEVSEDGQAWEPVPEAGTLPEPVRQSPQILTFPETTARWVKITATQLRQAEHAGGYLVSLAEVRVSLAVERPSEMAVFSIAPTDLFFDPLQNALAANVHNQSTVPGRATVEFYGGWSLEDAQHLGTAESSIAGPGGAGVAHLASSGSSPLEPGHCIPIWATLKAAPLAAVDLDTYGIGPMPVQTVFSSVCSPREAMIGDFDYEASPLTQGWELPSGETTEGSVRTVFDHELSSRVAEINTELQDGFVLRRPVSVYDRSQLSLWAKSSSAFILYVAVRDLSGDSYYVQYMPFSWASYPAEFPAGKYIYYPLGAYLADGSWHKLERDVYADFAAKTGKEVAYIEALSIRAYDSLRLAELRLAKQK
jgi:hypothetical protein